MGEGAGVVILEELESALKEEQNIWRSSWLWNYL